MAGIFKPTDVEPVPPENYPCMQETKADNMEKKIEVRLRLIAPFAWAEERIKTLLEESGITISEEYDEDLPVALDRLKRRIPQRTGQPIFTAHGYIMMIRDTPEGLIDFLKKIQMVLRDDMRSANERLSIITVHLEHTIGRSMFTLKKELNLTPELPKLKKAIGIKMRNACLDLFGPMDERNWYHLTVKPGSGDIVRTTSIRLAASRSRIEDAIALLESVPAMIDAIEQDLWER